MPSLLVTRTVRGLEATVMRISNRHAPIPTSVKSARSTVVITADKSRTALTTEMPVMRAVLLQLVFSISGARSLVDWFCAFGMGPTLLATKLNIALPALGVKGVLGQD